MSNEPETQAQASITADSFFNRYGKKPPTVFPVDLPDGQKVYVRVLTAREKTTYESEFADRKKKGANTARERLVVLCACDETGNRLFGPQHTEQVGAMECTITDPIFDKAFEVNGFEAKLAALAKKNSESDRTDD